MGISSADYCSVTVMFAVAALFEAIAEPLYVHAARCGRVVLRVRAESLGMFAKCVVAYLAVNISPENCGVCGLRAFAYSQLAYGFVYGLIFYWAYARDILSKNQELQEHSEMGTIQFTSLRSLFPRSVPAHMGGAFDRPLLKLTLSYLAQTASKLVLGEGEKIVMVSSSRISLNEQGFFALVQNLGSLVARLLFQPIEEGAASEFALQVRRIDALQSDPPRKLERPSLASSQYQDASAETPKTAALHSLGNTLARLVQVVTLIALFMVSFAFAYSLPFFDIVYGSKWSNTEAPRALILYMFYVLAMALNGVTEAFVDSCVHPADINLLNVLLFLIAACAMAIRVILVTDADGLIYVAILEMALRTIRSLWYIGKYFRQQHQISFSRRQLFPSSSTLALLLLSWFTTSVSFHKFVAPLCSSGEKVSGSGAGFDVRGKIQQLYHCNLSHLRLASKVIPMTLHIAVGIMCASATLWFVFKKTDLFQSWRGWRRRSLPEPESAPQPGPAPTQHPPAQK